MSRFTFNLATPADDAALCELLAATPMDGAISLAFARYPSYFEAARVDGRQVQVGVVRDGESLRIVGMGSRAINVRYVEGTPVPVGYLSGLRLMPEYRGRAGLLARGYRFLRELHQDEAASYYLTTVSTDNPIGQVLTSGRAGLPIYHPWGNYHTLTISTTHFARNRVSRNQVCHIRSAEESDRGAIVAFLNKWGPTRQFFPVYKEEDLFAAHGLLQGLRPEDVLLAIRNNKIVCTLGAWDQSPFKQIIVQRYRKWLTTLRPFYNVWAALRQQPLLPIAGTPLAARLATLAVVRNDNPTVWRLLLETLLHRLAQRDARLLLIGLHADDPLLPFARQLAGRDYVTTLFVVYWPEATPDLVNLQQRTPYLELGSL